MKSTVEHIDQRRMRHQAWFLVGSVLVLFLSMTRYFLRRSGLNEGPVGTAVLSGMILCLLLLVTVTYKSARLARIIKSDPALNEALNNEWVKAIEIQSWKAAFLAAVAINLLFAFSWFFYPLNDPVMIALTSIIAGSAAYQATFYFKYRAS